MRKYSPMHVGFAFPIKEQFLIWEGVGQVRLRGWGFFRECYGATELSILLSIATVSIGSNSAVKCSSSRGQGLHRPACLVEIQLPSTPQSAGRLSHSHT